MRGRSLLFAGATGLTGSQALPLLLEKGWQITALGRRPSGRVHPSLGEVQTDFRVVADILPADVAVSALGTTIRAAGSRAAFRAVDHEAVVAFARAAHRAGCRQFICVTAVGADPSATAFYSRVKGEAEHDLESMGFDRLDLLQPGLLLGPRAERRPVEALLQQFAPLLNTLLPTSLDRLGAIEARRVAAAIAALAGREGRGVFRHRNKDLRQLSTP